MGYDFIKTSKLRTKNSTIYGKVSSVEITVCSCLKFSDKRCLQFGETEQNVKSRVLLGKKKPLH